MGLGQPGFITDAQALVFVAGNGGVGTRVKAPPFFGSIATQRELAAELLVWGALLLAVPPP